VILTESRRVGRAKVLPVADAGEQDALGSISEEERRILGQVIEVLRRINFGTILLIVQDGKVVQIEMAEKFRLK
jgi:hypothetical protein